MMHCHGHIIWSLLLSLACQVAVAQTPFLNLDVNVTVTPAEKINTKYLEFAPTYYGDGIVFVHAREQQQDFIDKKLGQPFFELMFAELEPDGMPGRAVNFSPTIRTKFHEGPSCFTSDEQRIYFTRSNSSGGQEIKGDHDKATISIFTAVKGPDDWENVEKLWFSSDDYAVMHPTVSPDGDRMIFSSLMPGGYGGADLYITYRSFDQWSTPVNLGPVINTEGDEAFPFWHENGVLFFASEGHGSKGGYDIFGSLFADQIWRQPVNLGAPFNTRRDDIGLIIDKEGLTGFFASARKGSTGKDDIYAFSCSESLFNKDGIPVAKAPVSLAVLDAGTGAGIPNAKVLFVAMHGDGTQALNDLFDDEIVQDSSGKYTVTEQMLIELPADAVSTVTDRSGNAGIIVPVTSNVLVLAWSEDYYPRQIVIPARDLQGKTHIVSLEGKDVLIAENEDQPECTTVNGRVLKTYSTTPVENISVAIEDTCSNLRRIVVTDEEGLFTVCLPPECDYRVNIAAAGYLPEEKSLPQTAFDEEVVIYLTPEALEERGGPLDIGDVLVLDHIYYDFNKSAIRSGDAGDLRALAEMMKKYPEMEIELQSHTDSRGSEDYNLELSERRGVSAMEFLLARGIAQDRIRLKPMGESQLRNHCDDGVPCSEAEHQENRRTEIKILKVDGKLKIERPGG